jgi:uncharacterized protein YjbI with pentapeptide repeats
MSRFNSIRRAVKGFRASSLWALAFLLVLLGIIRLLVSQHVLGTGFDQQIRDLKPNEYYQPAKTLWDWLQLAGIPVALAFIAFLFQDASKRSEQRIALENQRNDILQKYIDEMSKLIVSPEWEAAIKQYRESRKHTNPQIVARARTQVALSALQSEPPDARRRGQIVRFLSESGLLQQEDAASQAVIDLNGTDLRGVDLSRADLSKSDLRGVDLTGADLRLANLRDALEDTVDPDSRYRESEPYRTKFDPKWQLVLEILNKPKIGRDLTNKDLREAFLSKADLSYAKLCRANFRGANLAKASLFKADLRGANFREAVLDLADLRDSRIDWMTRMDKKWRLVWQLLSQQEGREALLNSLSDADLAHAHLFYALMPKARLENADLSNANLEGAWLSGATFGERTKLLGTNFEKAHMEECHLDGCYIGLCNLKEARLSAASLTGARCSISKLDGADLTGAQLKNAELWNVSLAGATLVKADFTGAVLKEVDCTGANLRDAIITKEQLAAISPQSGATLPDGSKAL